MHRQVGRIGALGAIWAVLLVASLPIATPQAVGAQPAAGLSPAQHKADSLRRVMAATPPNDTSRVRAMLNLAWHYRTYRPDSGLALARQALALAQRLQVPRSQADAYNRLGTLFRLTGNPDSARAALGAALHLYTSLGDSSGRAYALMNLGNVLYNNADYANALRHYQEARLFFHNIGDSAREVGVLNNMGNIYNEIGAHHLAMECWTALVQHPATFADPRALAGAYINMSGSLDVIHERTRARDLCLRGATIAFESGNLDYAANGYVNLGVIYEGLNRLDSSEYYLNKALEMDSLSGHNRDNLLVYILIAELHQKSGKITLAQEWYNKALQTLAKRPQSQHKASMYQRYADFLLATGRTPEAIDRLRESLRIAAENGETKVYAYSLLRLGNTLASLGQHAQAYPLLAEYRTVMDSLTSLTRQRQIAKLVAVQALEIENSLAEQQQAQAAAAHEAAQRRHNALVYSGVTLALVLFGLLLVASRRLRRPRLQVAARLLFLLLLFEFLLVLLDPWLDATTEANPLAKLVANLAVALLMLPLDRTLARLQGSPPSPHPAGRQSA